jgi:hypothetical protein
MGHLFWLSDEAWAAIQPIFQPTNLGHDGSMTGGSSAVFFMFSRRAAAGAIAPRSMVPTPPSKTASTAGPGASYGSACSRPW